MNLSKLPIVSLISIIFAAQASVSCSDSSDSANAPIQKPQPLSTATPQTNTTGTTSGERGGETTAVPPTVVTATPRPAILNWFTGSSLQKCGFLRKFGESEILNLSDNRVVVAENGCKISYINSSILTDLSLALVQKQNAGTERFLLRVVEDTVAKTVEVKVCHTVKLQELCNAASMRMLTASDENLSKLINSLQIKLSSAELPELLNQENNAYEKK